MGGELISKTNMILSGCQLGFWIRKKRAVLDQAGRQAGCLAGQIGGTSADGGLAILVRTEQYDENRETVDTEIVVVAKYKKYNSKYNIKYNNF